MGNFSYPDERERDLDLERDLEYDRERDRDRLLAELNLVAVVRAIS